MVKSKRTVAGLVALVILGIGIFLGARLAPLLGWSSPSRVYSTPVLLKQVQTLSQLVTVEYVLERVEVWNDPPKNLLGQFLAGDNRILILAHGIVKAGVDLSKLTPEDLRIEGKKIVVHLPSGEITDAYLDDSQTKVIERTTGFLRTFDKNLEQHIREQSVDDLRRAAFRGGIIQDAEERAQAQLANLFLQLGFEKVEFRPAHGLIPNLIDGTARESVAGTNR